MNADDLLKVVRANGLDSLEEHRRSSEFIGVFKAFSLS
jgi:hypothetical protein